MPSEADYADAGCVAVLCNSCCCGPKCDCVLGSFKLEVSPIVTVTLQVQQSNQTDAQVMSKLNKQVLAWVAEHAQLEDPITACCKQMLFAMLQHMVQALGQDPDLHAARRVCFCPQTL